MEDVIRELVEIVGKDWVITRREQMEGYLVDETPIPVRPKPASNVILVKPANAREVSEILKLANRRKIPVFPRGGGTGLVGGAIPTRDGIVLSVERMDEIEIDRENMMAVVGAGVTLEKLLKVVEEAGMLFPPHPGDEGARMGGLVACNAGGSRAVKYGVMREYVKGIEVVLPTGEIVDMGGKLLKNNTGYSLMHLMIGSEGTLGVITKVILRLYPKFGATATLIVPYERRQDAINTVPKILQAGIIPLALEYVERDCIEKSAEHLGRKWPCREGKAFLIIIVAGASVDEVYSESERISSICQENGSSEPLIAESREEQERILDIRSNIYNVIKPETVDILDVTVPPANMGKLMDAVDGIAKKYGAYIPTYGHAGDGNLHVHLMKGGEGPEYYRKLKEEIYGVAIDLGGVITGEHGIGKIRTVDLRLCLSEKEIQLMKGIKELFDPNNILNPA
jgi:glycolate oxidase